MQYGPQLVPVFKTDVADDSHPSPPATGLCAPPCLQYGPQLVPFSKEDDDADFKYPEEKGIKVGRWCCIPGGLLHSGVHFEGLTYPQESGVRRGGAWAWGWGLAVAACVLGEGWSGALGVAEGGRGQHGTVVCVCAGVLLEAGREGRHPRLQLPC